MDYETQIFWKWLVYVFKFKKTPSVAESFALYGLSYVRGVLRKNIYSKNIYTFPVRDAISNERLT